MNVERYYGDFKDRQLEGWGEMVFANGDRSLPSVLKQEHLEIYVHLRLNIFYDVPNFDQTEVGIVEERCEVWGLETTRTGSWRGGAR